MTNRDALSIPLAAISLITPGWIQFLQNFWSVVLPAAGAVLVVLQICYYWKQLRKK